MAAAFQLQRLLAPAASRRPASVACPAAVAQQRRSRHRSARVKRSSHQQPVPQRYATAAAAAAAAAGAPPAPGRHLPARQLPPEPQPWQEAQQGFTLYADGSASFRVWAPHASAVVLQLVPAGQYIPAALKTGTLTTDSGGGGGEFGAEASAQLMGSGSRAGGDAEVEQPGMRELPLSRHGDDWGADLPAGKATHGTAYRLVVTGPAGGPPLMRRDPWARSADPDTCWCFLHSPDAYNWTHIDWQPPSFDKYIIYEMHVGSFTTEGTLAAASARLGHVASLGFTAVELLPCQEHSDSWGYSPRQLLALQRQLGTPEDMAAFVDTAHGLGLAVIMDLVLHHGAPSGNMLWDFDGWEEGHNGGIYHENAPDCAWGRQWAFWKAEVRRMLLGAAEMWLGEYRMDGLRFDSVKDVPFEVVQEMTWALRSSYPGRLLTAEITPEDPQLMAAYGFDAIWVHSGYFDIIQQHRALGRGHHGGGDWAGGWDLPRLRTAMGLHHGFQGPAQCIKYMTGSHDQVGCQRNGGWYDDYAPVGGHHRYAVDQFCGGRGDSWARAAARLWYAANVAAAGLPLVFMGTEFAQSGWWHNDEWHRLQWEHAEDDVGLGTMAAVRDANALRARYPALRTGWANCIHEDRLNGVMGYERCAEGEARVIVVVNAARGRWQAGEYGLWVGGGGAFQQVYCSQDPQYGGDPTWISNDTVQEYDGRIHLNIPPSCTLMLVQRQ